MGLASRVQTAVRPPDALMEGGLLVTYHRTGTTASRADDQVLSDAGPVGEWRSVINVATKHALPNHGDTCRHAHGDSVSTYMWPQCGHETECLGCVVSHRKIERYWPLSDVHEKGCIQHSRLQA